MRPKNIRRARPSADKSMVSLPGCLPKRQQLAALSVPKCENAFGFHRLIPRQFDSVVLCATSTLTLPSSVNATTACSGCRARCSHEFILSFSADKGGRCSPRHRERNCLASAFACSSFGLVSGALALKSPPVVSKTGHERKRIKIEIFKPFGESFEVMKKILFQPFDLKKWLVIGFAAWLANLGGSGGGADFNYPDNRGEEVQKLNETIGQIPQPVLITGICVLICVVLLLIVVFAWLRAREI